MAEIAAGFAGAGTTFAAAKIATLRRLHRASRVQPSRRACGGGPQLPPLPQRISGQRQRNVPPRRGCLSQKAELIYIGHVFRSQESLNEYYDSLNKYKDESWFRLPAKSRSAERLGSLRGLLETRITTCARVSTRYPRRHPGMGRKFPLYAESGSPPGSGLERERIEDWIAQSGDSPKESEPEAVGIGAPVLPTYPVMTTPTKRRDELRNGYQRLKAVIPDDFLEGETLRSAQRDRLLALEEQAKVLRDEIDAKVTVMGGSSASRMPVTPMPSGPPASSVRRRSPSRGADPSLQASPSASPSPLSGGI
ncbi:hypothetical protein C8J57DRAFT_1237081 [Mycena rebaudengoi]|nr:hypothetical protein C8J57DRAFT_1237081 [Mycena rebaudengoi]